MSKVQERIAQIRTQLVGESGARVLLVEGSDDVDAFRIFLDKKFPAWEQAWHLVEAGNKRMVQKIAAVEPQWLGLVDRDEWMEDEIQQYMQETPNLLVLPRFCLESYLVDPDELWAAFPQKQRDKIVGGQAAFFEAFSQGLKPWIRHAALWQEIRPLWQRLRGAGFPDAVLDAPNVPDEPTLRERLLGWRDTLDVENIVETVRALEAALAEEGLHRLCTQRIHAKSFYPKYVHPLLDRLLGQKDARTRRISVLRTRAVPDDLGVVWQRMGFE
ncbi:DUF4435 domain-containing protein [Aromatoleum anaerobium]|uniref:DUF4435 domain-containing protein n=1 Tax=Aromatoleum anaerobium TaxID=182180 RepID=A0ABX1PH66_9RHOO|nr:DUF4435 domain-containing protein [Aromatoleum anaerobium]MCK0506218.1 DUF4435 domain-containing protein [Aromatoleum anaerobium]